MFSVCPKSLILLLLCAACTASAVDSEDEDKASTASTASTWPPTDESNEESPPGYPPRPEPAEVIYLDMPIFPEPKVEDGNVSKLNGSDGGLHNRTNVSRISEDALLFLTGPVSTIFMPSFYTLVCLTSVPINICAVVAFAFRIRPKKPAVIYMLNLACADLIFALLLPFKISYHFRGNNWIFGWIMCRVVTAAFYWNMYSSVLIITCISVDRLLAVVYPINSLTWRRPRNSIIACVAMWILSLAGSVPLLISEQTFHLEELNITTCHDLHPIDEEITHYKIYFITLCCALFFLPLLITLVSYTRVIWVLSGGQRSDPDSSRRRNRAVVMVLTVLVMFVLCFTPANCLLLAYYLQIDAGVKKSEDAPDGSYAVYLVFMCLGSLNCLMDPLLYYFGSSQCQKQLSSALRCKKIGQGSTT